MEGIFREREDILFHEQCFLHIGAEYGIDAKCFW